MITRKKRLLFFTLPAVTVLAVWLYFMYSTASWELFRDNWYMTLVMIFGSFIAGASSEGGGAIAYPVMTLLFNIDPDVARNFSFAIQSVGMTFASVWIITSGIKIEQNYLLLAGLGGFAGIIFGTIYIAPLIKPDFAKMMFVSFWLSFGIALWIVNFVNNRKSLQKLPVLSVYQKSELLLVGIAGGIFSSVLGNGLDICTFSFVVIKYGLSEKIATPTSVILMASNAIAGFILHTFFLDSMQPEAINFWLVCIPVVIFGAPFGAFVINRIGRKKIALLLILIIITQFFTALYVIRPGLQLGLFSLVIFLTGMILFFVLTRTNHHSKKTL